MSNQNYHSYSLRDLFRMGFSTKRNRLGRSHSKHHRSKHHQPRTSRYPSHYEEYPNYVTGRNAYITNLPPELQLSIFDALDPVSSTCLGLSSKKLYPIHKSYHKKVGLYDTPNDRREPLCMLLKDWAPPDLVLDWRSERLVNRERHGVRERDRDRYWESSYPIDVPERQYVKHPRQPFYQQYYDEPRPKLKRRRRFEMHDNWYGGRRRF